MSCDSQIKYKDKKNTKKKIQQSNKNINVTYLFLNTYFYIDRICFIFLSQGEGCVLVTLPRVPHTVPTVLLIDLPSTSPIDGQVIPSRRRGFGYDTSYNMYRTQLERTITFHVTAASLVQWLTCSPRVRQIVGSSSDRVNLKTRKLLFISVYFMYILVKHVYNLIMNKKT